MIRLQSFEFDTCIYHLEFILESKSFLYTHVSTLSNVQDRDAIACGLIQIYIRGKKTKPVETEDPRPYMSVSYIQIQTILVAIKYIYMQF